jgi:hypothetical protein
MPTAYVAPVANVREAQDCSRNGRKGRKGLLKDNADDLRSAHGDRGVRFGFAHAKAAKGGKDCERQF